MVNCRDSYIQINYENIKRGLRGQFRKYSLRRIQHLGAEYDYGSIMHYRSLSIYLSIDFVYFAIRPYWKSKLFLHLQPASVHSERRGHNHSAEAHQRPHRAAIRVNCGSV